MYNVQYLQELESVARTLDFDTNSTHPTVPALWPTMLESLDWLVTFCLREKSAYAYCHHSDCEIELWNNIINTSWTWRVKSAEFVSKSLVDKKKEGSGCKEGVTRSFSFSGRCREKEEQIFEWGVDKRVFCVNGDVNFLKDLNVFADHF